MMELGTFPFVKTRHFTPANRGIGDVDLIVIHTAETPETASSAEGVARYFATTDREVSAHYCVDVDSIVQCVRLEDVAWCAPGANHDGIHIELSGRANQTRAQWSDAFSRGELELAAQLVRLLVKRYAIPVRQLVATDLVAGRRGITTHAEVSRAFKRSTHWDPGSGFPMREFLRAVGNGPTAAIRTAKPDPLLRLGMNGWQVKRAQRLLEAWRVKSGRMLPPLEVDGVYGLKTKSAVVAFQAAHGLERDGVIGPRTWSSLRLEGRA